MTEPAPFAERLLAWWARHGRHDLPWQRPRTPYRVWVAEIMLQQTQVATVIPYFERFLERFPTLPELAGTSLDEVLALWSGLGYYARARHLHSAAQMCVAEHGGELPRQAQQLAALPGIGESTANAIVSQAWDVPAVVLDGNVRRVLARHDAVAGWPGQAAVHRSLWQAAADRLPDRCGADYTQAIMDLGATLCRRTKPDCEQCPVHDDCMAFRSGRVAQFPAPRPRIRVRTCDLSMLLLTRPDGSVLLERRPPAGIWGGLWCLPQADSPARLAHELGLAAPDLQPLSPLEHRLTHRLLRIQPWLCRSAPRAHEVKCETARRWFAADEWPQLGLPRPVLTLLERHLTGDKT